jgi:hypothetical protein
MSDDFVVALQDLIPEAVSNQICYINMGQILNSYGDVFEM